MPDSFRCIFLDSSACRAASTPIRLEWAGSSLNLITTIGSYLFALGVVLLLVNVAISLRRGRIAGPNPWDADSLEWAMPSPPPPYNFVVIPVIASRWPLWEARLQMGSQLSSLDRGLVLDHGKEVLASSSVDAEPEVILKMPEDSILPLGCAIAVTVVFVAALLHVWWLAGIAALVVAFLTLVWLWPRDRLARTADVHP